MCVVQSSMKLFIIFVLQCKVVLFIVFMDFSERNVVSLHEVS